MPGHSILPIAPERIAANLKTVRERIGEAAVKGGRRSEEVSLVAVTKYVGIEEVRALLALGLRALGENRLQAALPKITALGSEASAAGAHWRFIGHLQTNKVRPVLRNFGAIDALDSPRLLDALANETEKQARPPMPCLVEVNVSGEERKYGLRPGELQAFLGRASERPACEIRGLMTMAPFSGDPERISRPVFRGLRELFETANAKRWYRKPLAELSMGMTSDYAAAVEEGATMVRIGTALFA